ncbi:DUF6706 family protein [Sphingobacterium yanglingense]|uniref:Uncharacterized protein n=1 Tax=Sphingobacterium yanglingense TaxID=1437280 RepID=A0A4R6WLG5_9SPHI|nr:DUF6706 family protein [Sphingobacterium yanglingense]TDQ79582.1 hypothetical protein CLV99_1027 [Sphingobacterium yanglingense]
MTKKEAFINVVQVGTVDDSTAEMYLLSKGIVPDDSFTGDLDELELAAIPCIQSLITVSSQSEGSASWSMDREGIKQRLLFLARKHGLDDVVNAIDAKPIVKAYNNWGL